MRLIVDNGKVEYDIPYDSVLLEVRESNGGAGLMYCGAVSQMSIYAFATIEQGKNVLQEIATANVKDALTTISVVRWNVVLRSREL